MKARLYKDQKNTMYELQFKLGLSINTLYKYARKETSIDKMPIGVLIGLAKLENKEPIKLYYEMEDYLNGRYNGTSK